MEKVNLIFFIPEFIKGGAGNSVFSLVKNLDKRKYSINIICLGKCHYKYEISNYAKIYELKYERTIFAQKKLSYIIKKITFKYRKNIFISNFFYVNVLISLFQKNKKNLKYIFTERTTLTELYTYFGAIDFLKKLIIKILVKLFYKKAYLIISNSKKVSKEIQQFTSAKSIYIYPGSYKNVKYKKKYHKDKKLNIIWVGRLSEEKGIEDVLNALNELKKDKYLLNIVGEGKKKKQIRNLIKTKKLNNNVKLHGFKKDIPFILKKSDLLINTSYFEGFPNVVVEALTYQVPVICSKSGGGVFEILKNGKYGDLYEKGDVDLLKMKIENHMKNPQRLVSKSILGSKDLKRFSEKVSTKKYEKLFDSIKF